MKVVGFIKRIFDRKVFDHHAFLVSCAVFPMYTLYWCVTHLDNPTLLVTLYGVVFLGGINLTLFPHRCWSHRSWQPTARWLHWLGLFVNTITISGSSLGWAGTHRKHHKFQDTYRDPHSPYFISRWKVIFWPRVMLTFHPEYIPDLLKEPDHLFFTKYYWHINITWGAVLLIIDPALLLFWFAFIGGYGFKMRLVNVIGHNGNRTHTNFNPLLMLIYPHGEAWHGNHHEDPKNWYYGRKWYEIDMGAWLIRLFVKLNIAKTNT